METHRSLGYMIMWTTGRTVNIAANPRLEWFVPRPRARLSFPLL